MSFQSTGAAQKRNWNALMVEGAAPAVSGGIFRLNSTFGTMNFAAQYLAIHPDAVALGGSMNPAATGSNLSASGNEVTTSGVGTSFGTVGIFAPDVVAWEFEVVSMEPGVLYSVGYAGDIGFGLDDETTPSLQFPPCAFDCYFSDGTTEDNVGSDFGTAISIGDSIGFVYEADLGRIEFYHNGVPQVTNPVMNTGGFAYVSQEP